MVDTIRQICDSVNLHYKNSSSVSGGDINKAFSIDAAEGRFFLKLNSAAGFPAMFKKEAQGLKALQQVKLLKVPGVVAFGELNQYQYLLLEWLEKASPSPVFWNNFAEALAQQHRISNTHFGSPSANYIGSLGQQNSYTETWAGFYTTQRILPLAEKLFNRTLLSKTDVQAAEKLCSRFEEIFPAEPPALLHGDLWAGNFMAAKKFTGDSSSEVVPAVYDPAVYFGHREMDLGMSLLFGGFDKRFYELYHDYYPLGKGWQKRVRLTQLYPLLVHAVLFGGGYVNQCRNILNGNDY